MLLRLDPLAIQDILNNMTSLESTLSVFAIISVNELTTLLKMSLSQS